MNKNFVSIITPCHNASAYIAQTIESVLSQTYSNWEMLICDDASTDNSVEIISSYVEKDYRIKLLKLDSPSGSPAKPRNEAIKHASGDVIAFLDSDDVWLPTKLEEQLPLLKDEKTAVVYSNYEKIDERGIRNNRIVTAPLQTTYVSLLKSNVIGNLTGMYDVNKVGKVYNKRIHHEDYILWLEILKKGYIARNTATVTALYRVTSNSVSSNKFKTIGWQWNILRNIEHQNIILSLYYFCCYVCKALKKSFI